MIIDAHSGLRGTLVNLDTMQRIPQACWANLATGEYEAIMTDASGKKVKYKSCCNRLAFIDRNHPAVTQQDAPMAPDRLKDGLAVYCDIFSKVWNYRGLARRCVADLWTERRTQQTCLNMRKRLALITSQ